MFVCCLFSVPFNFRAWQQIIARAFAAESEFETEQTVVTASVQQHAIPIPR